jgi:hypothetical protein
LRKSSVYGNDLASNVIGSGGSQSEIKSLTPLGRLGQDGDLKGIAVFLFARATTAWDMRVGKNPGAMAFTRIPCSA